MSNQSVNLKLRRAHQLIKAQDYTKARQLLIDIDHPTAYKWIVMLDRIARQSRQSSHRNNPLASIVFALLTVVSALALACIPVNALYNYFVDANYSVGYTSLLGGQSILLLVLFVVLLGSGWVLAHKFFKWLRGQLNI